MWMIGHNLEMTSFACGKVLFTNFWNSTLGLKACIQDSSPPCTTHSTSPSVFLDQRISTGGPIILTQMYSKNSDTSIIPTSCHPAHVCRNSPKGVLKRVKRNCTEGENCNEGFFEYMQHLLNSGYDNSLIDQAMQDARATPREQLLGIAE